MPPPLVPTLRNPRYISLLVLVAALILVVGALTRPRDEAAPPASDADLARLSRLAERHSLDNTTSYFGTIATTAESSLVRVVDRSASGVVWETGSVLAARTTDPFPDKLNVMAAGVSAEAPVTLRRPDLPLVSMALATDTLVVPERRAGALVRPEEWVLAVWTGEEMRSYVHGNVLDVRSAQCEETAVTEVVPSFTLTPSMAGGGLFDLDGHLIGVILPCGDRLGALDTESIARLLGRAASMSGTESGLLSRYGMRAGVPSADEAAYFTQPDTVIVREVWSGYPADAADLRPGDVIRFVDDAPVKTLDDLASIASSDGITHLRIRRGTGTIDIELGVASNAPVVLATPDGALPDRGLSFGAVDGYQINAVTPGSAAAAAGIEAGDRLLRVNHAAPTGADQVRRLLGGARGRAALLEIERGRRRFGVVLK